jgi:hypothetical protein
MTLHLKKCVSFFVCLSLLLSACSPDKSNKASEFARTSQQQEKTDQVKIDSTASREELVLVRNASSQSKEEYKAATRKLVLEYNDGVYGYSKEVEWIMSGVSVGDSVMPLERALLLLEHFGKEKRDGKNESENKEDKDTSKGEDEKLKERKRFFERYKERKEKERKCNRENRNICYKILNVTKNITPTELQKYYHRMSIKFHPDKCPIYEVDYCELAWQEFNDAYDNILNADINADINADKPVSDDAISYGKFDFEKFNYEREKEQEEFDRRWKSEIEQDKKDEREMKDLVLVSENGNLINLDMELENIVQDRVRKSNPSIKEKKRDLKVTRSAMIKMKCKNNPNRCHKYLGINKDATCAEIEEAYSKWDKEHTGSLFSKSECEKSGHSEEFCRINKEIGHYMYEKIKEMDSCGDYAKTESEKT